MKWILTMVLVLVFFGTPRAETGANLLLDLDEYVDDSLDELMTGVQKLRFLNHAGRELGKALVYFKLDTIITVDSIESYGLNGDAVGVLRSAYIKRGTDRVWLQIVDHDELRNLPKPTASQILYAFATKSSDSVRITLHAIPQVAETLVVSYYVFPSDVVDAATEWDLPAAYQDPAVRIAASKILFKVQTEWGFRTRQQLYEMGWADVARFKNPGSEVRQVGDSP